MKTEKMKILMVCKSLPWRFKGGIQSHTWDLSNELTQMNQDVTILTAGGFLKSSDYKKSGIRIIEIPYLPGRIIKPIANFAEEFFFNVSVLLWLFRNAKNFDIIHLQGRSGYLYALLKSRIPYVQTVHGLIDKENSRIKGINSFSYKRLMKPFERLQTNNSARIISVSRDLKTSLIEHDYSSSDKVSVIPNGVPFSDIQENEICNCRLVFVGRLSEVKNVGLIISIMDNLNKNISLDIIGDGPLLEELNQMVKEKNLQDRVKFHGALNRAEIYRKMQQSGLLVLPSLYETQGIVLLEANANGIPVVASDLPSIRESIKHGYNGLLCPVNHKKSFVEAIEFLCSNPAEASAMGANGRKMVRERFNWSVIADETIRVYKSLKSENHAA